MENDEFIEEPAVNDSPKPKKGKTGLIIGIVVVVLILLGALAFFLVNAFMLNEKKVVEKEINLVFDGLHKTFDEAKANSISYDLDKESIGMEGNLSFSSDYKDDEIDLSKLDKYKFTYKGVLDKKNNKASGNISLNGDEKILSLDAYITGKDLYLKSTDIYNKTITTKLDKEIKDLDSTNIDLDDIEKIITKTEKVTKNTIQKNNISKETVEKEINGTKKKVTKVTYELDTNQYATDLLKGYRDDEEIVQILSDILDKKKYEMEKDLDDAISDLEESNEKSKMTINTYLSGLTNKIVEIELVEEDSNIIIDIDEDVYKYKMYVDNEEVIRGEYDAKNASFTAYMDADGTKLNIEVKKEKNNKYTGTIEMEADGEEVKIDYDFSNTVKKNNQKTDFNLKVSYNDGETNVSASIKGDLSISKNVKVDEIPTNDAKTVDAIDENEIVTIYDNLSKKLTKVIKDIYPAYDEVNNNILDNI